MDKEFVGVQNGWAICYKKAISDNGELLFPERLSREFLAQARQTMGSYLFANQYQNEVIADEDRRFKTEWFKHHDSPPDNCYKFAFVDPAIGQQKHHDYTSIVIVHVDYEGKWWVEVANRYRMSPTDLVEKLFKLQEVVKLNGIGIEIVAYQEALLYMLAEQMRLRKIVLPVQGIKRDRQSKNSRILGLVPRFEWGRISLAKGLTDLEDELTTFPRASYDDLSDALSSLEEMVYYPEKKEAIIEKPNSPGDIDYERWYISQLAKGRTPTNDNDREDFLR